MGSFITRTLLDAGHWVRGIDKITYAANESLLKEFYSYERFKFQRNDIAELDWLYDCDYIVNLAAETHVDNSIVKSDDFIHSNINGVHNILELIRKNHHFDMPIFMHFSTDEVYGDIKQGAHTETDLLRPSNPYSATKAAADQLILAWNKTYGVPYIIVRPTNNYGIGQYVEKLIPKVCKFMSVGRKIPLHEKGNPYRVWLHAQDTANAILLLIENGIKNSIYNISGPESFKNIEVVNKVLDLYFKNMPEQSNNYSQYLDTTIKRIGQDKRYAINDEKIKNLGWVAERRLDDELSGIVNYYKKNFIW